MPPQTHLTAEIARDGAALGLDRAKTAAANAARGVQAAPRPAASIAVLRDAVSEKDAAGPPGAAAPGWLGRLAQYWLAFQDGRRRRRMRLDLSDLSEAQLVDIGLSRVDIDHIAAHRALERFKDNTAHLMMSRGVM
ncbi:hypothetical protein SSBR45G_12980 [Bradyrhizobium sp. SSBR45G]|uniref:DUF1127 domain-containing protein n=1 Tax=unclassified Bradyrhizobium TaxID=2631580 RepID=UPI0023428EAF|nr:MULTISPECIES: DUF1127 domain-containing protein [unclassified Bradyrhizobium]GLH76390.1 hypothetical protein SSBR45G_12980 [Bradyrhizobium sp. SSBR45G]GLH83126.1 hypothetical protein SSBR45R_05860 [Bradyrhizobium sp. SSBR45R]